jgi:tetratricopeptide (TPR) repeat protein
LNPNQLFIVPGNHDLDRDEFTLLPRDPRKPLASEAEVQNWLTDSRKRSHLLEPFQAFSAFVKEFTGQEQPDYVNVRRMPIGDKEIALLGLNSAWMCGRNKDKIGDKGFVIVGEPQIHSILEEISNANLKIAVLHHPFDWLAEFDCNRIEVRLRQSCDFILRGHQHKPRVEITSGTSGDCIIIPAGASYDRRIAENPLYTNSYNFVHMDCNTGKGTVFLRRWSDPRNKWIEDIDSCDGGECEFSLFESASVGSSSEKATQPAKNIPHQIPPPPRDFKGREDEIRDILSNFEKGATITGLCGMGGVGKTALALVLADKIKNKFPDGQIFIEMRGTSRNPALPLLTSDEAMSHVIRAFNPADKLPENSNELRGLYHSILAGKRVLLLLDNAAGSEQVEPLLPPEGCSVLITSRIKFALPGLAEKDLDILPPDKARELLLEIAPRIDNRADELAKLCGYLPLALRNAGKALAEKKDLGVSEYEKRLRNKMERIELVKASFSTSYDLLSSGRKKQWRRLSVFPEDFDREAATAVLKMSPSASAEALSDLVRWSLLDYVQLLDSEDGRYKLHDLARLFADSCLEPDEVIDAQQKHAKYFLKLLSQSENLYEKGGTDLLAGLELFDREWANIKVGHAWIRNRIQDHRKLTKSDSKIIVEMANSYANDGILVLDLRLHPRDLIFWLETGLKAARIKEDRSAEANHLGNLGLAYSDLGETHKALEYHKQALKISSEIGDKWGKGVRLSNLGNAYLELGETLKAIEYFEQSLKISHEIGDKRTEGVDLGNLGSAYSALGETPKAIEYHEQALKISQDIGDRRNEGVWLGNLGSVYADLGETRKAIEYHEQALKISREIGAKRGEGADMGNLGLAYADLGDMRKAIEYHEQALKTAQDIGDRRNEGESLSNLGKAYADINEPGKAIDYCLQSLDIVCKIEYRKIEGEALCTLDKAYSEINEISKALDYCNQALRIFREMEYSRGEGDALFCKSLALYELGQRKEALDGAKAALQIFEQIESPHAKKVRQKLAEWQGPDRQEI